MPLSVMGITESSDMGTLSGKAAVVTGGSRGIGAAIARRLAQEGADVAVTYVSSREKAEAVVREIEALGRRGLAIHSDAADAEASARGVTEAADAFGRLDILVANAGVGVFAPLHDYTLADFDKTFDINVRGVFAASQAAVRRMERGGRVIVIGSVNADRMPFAGGAVYGASKSAVQGLVRGWARDLGPLGITANVIQPGPVDTDLNPDDGPFAESLKALMAIPEYAQGEDVASLTAWLAGPESRYVTGAALTLDGGFGA
jgi:3-oxoacyl-[acyl-carrier protein] reductase